MHQLIGVIFKIVPISLTSPVNIRGPLLATFYQRRVHISKLMRDVVSPFKVVAVNRYTGELTPIFYTNGTLMSGGSTGLMVEDDLYIGQVFGSFILKVSDIEL